MQNNDHKEYFESFLKEKADQYKMYPSEKLWTNLNRELHSRKKWPYLVVAVIFLGLGTAGKIYDSRFSTQFNHQLSQSLLSNPTVVIKSPSQVFNQSKPIKINDPSAPDNKIGGNQKPSFLNTSIAIKFPETGVPLLSDQVSNGLYQSVETSPLHGEISGSFITVGLSSPSFQKTSIPQVGKDQNKLTPETKASAIKVLNPRKNRLGWQLYVSPTISYRKLSGYASKYNNFNSATTFASTPGYPRDVNNAVSQSPSVGMELGTAMIYSLSKRFRLKGGLQFNYSQYNINAFNYKAEIAPFSAAGIGHTEINGISFHRNFDGYSKTLLRNEHFMISIPIGVEVSVLGNDRVQFNIAGTLQPGLFLNNQAYMISTNLKNYAKESSLYRNFNVNGAMEAFLSFKSGSTTWVAGPQFRYQLFSSYKQPYPIKEHLFDYGFKVGIMKTLK